MTINRYIGIPYLFQGSTLHGADCIGLVRIFYQDEYSIMLPNYASILNGQDAKEIRSLFGSAMSSDVWTRVDLPKEGDVVLLNVFGTPFHCGVYIPGNKMLHILKNTDSVVEKLSGIRWKNRIEGFYRYKGAA